MLVDGVLREFQAPDYEHIEVKDLCASQTESEKSESEGQGWHPKTIEMVKTNVAELLHSIATKITDNPKIWSIYARFQLGIGNVEQVKSTSACDT